MNLPYLSDEWYEEVEARVKAELGQDAIEKERYSLLYGRIFASGRFKKHG